MEPPEWEEFRVKWAMAVLVTPDLKNTCVLLKSYQN